MKLLLIIAQLSFVIGLLGQETAKNKIPTLLDKSNCALTKSVFGWHPYWLNGTENNYQWHLLSDLSFFSYDVDAATGNATSLHGFTTNNAVDSALTHGINVHLTVTLFSNHAVFLTNTTAQTTLISNLINLISSRGAIGINIDFEGVPSSQTTNFSNFILNLGSSLHAANPNYQLSVCLYAVDWNNIFDEQTLLTQVDFFTLMGYDYYYSGSSQAGPTDPLYGFTSSYDYSLSRSVTTYINNGIPASKIILGLPYYGREWETTSSTIPSATTGNNISSRTYNYVQTNSSGYYMNPISYTKSSSKAYIFQNAGTWRQCWISEENELMDRYDFVKRRQLKGVGIWTLGYDDGYSELWSAIETKLTNCTNWACSDTLFDEGGPEGQYYNNENFIYTISPPNATSISVNFIEFNTELNNDTLWIYDGPSINSPLIGYYHGSIGPGQFNTNFGQLTLQFKSDASTRSSGWKMAYSCQIDTLPPQITSTIPSNWVTADDSITFSQLDNFAVTKSFYNVQSLNSSNWNGAINFGHVYEDFQNQTSWTTYTGQWDTLNGMIIQSDETSGNTNLSLGMPNLTTDSYLFHWKGSIAGNGTNRRAGMHFMCSDLSLTNRGNSYFIWFRIDNDVIQLYKVTNDVFSLVASYPYDLNANVNYDCKTVVTSSTGSIEIFIDNVYLGNWVDNSPHTTNVGLSLRSGNSIFRVDLVGAYKQRNATNYEAITVGPNKEFNQCNPLPTIPSGRIINFGIDAAHNIGTSISYHNIDFTIPVLSIPQEEQNDLDTIINTNQVNFYNLIGFDTNSGIDVMFYSLEKLDGSILLNPTPVTSNSIITSISGLENQTNYRIKLVGTNGAGLSDTIYSDGFIFLNTTNTEQLDYDSITIFPNPFLNNVNIVLSKPEQVSIIDSNGKLIFQDQLEKGENKIVSTYWTNGIYLLIIQNKVYKIIKV